MQSVGPGPDLETHFQVSSEQSRGGQSALKALVNFFADRASLEESYAKNLQRLAREPFESEYPIFTTMGSALRGIRVECDSIGAAHLASYREISENVVTHLSSLKQDTQAANKRLFSEGQRLAKDHSLEAEKLAKSQSKYQKLTREAEVAAQNARSATDPSSSSKLSSKATQAAREAKMAEMSFSADIQRLSESHLRYQEAMTTTIRVYQRNRLHRVHELRSILRKFLSIEETALEMQRSAVESLGALIEKIDVDEIDSLLETQIVSRASTLALDKPPDPMALASLGMAGPISRPLSPVDPSLSSSSSIPSSSSSSIPSSSGGGIMSSLLSPILSIISGDSGDSSSSNSSAVSSSSYFSASSDPSISMGVASSTPATRQRSHNVHAATPPAVSQIASSNSSNNNGRSSPMPSSYSPSPSRSNSLTPLPSSPAASSFANSAAAAVSSVPPHLAAAAARTISPYTFTDEVTETQTKLEEALGAAFAEQPLSAQQKEDIQKAISDPYGRHAFAKALNMMRAKQSGLCLKEVAFASLSDFLRRALLSLDPDLEVRTGRLLLNMCQTFYRQTLEGTEYLQSAVKDLDIWRNMRFWEGAFFDAVEVERIKQNSNLPSWRTMDEAERQESMARDENITFGQLSSFAFNMINMGLGAEISRAFVEKMCMINSMSDRYQQILLENVQTTAESAEKQNWLASQKEEWKKAREKRRFVDRDPVPVVSSSPTPHSAALVSPTPVAVSSLPASLLAPPPLSIPPLSIPSSPASSSPSSSLPSSPQTTSPRE